VLSEVLFDRLAGEVRSGTRSAVRIWSAACSTGQEPYSIAISALEHYRRNRRLPPERLEIIATDVSPTVLFLARAGRYDQLAISRGLSPELRDRYFVPDGKVWKIQDEVKRMVSFKKLNLQESFMSLGRMDIIFCRNVLIYFSDEFKRDVLSRMARSLNSPGYLFVGASESLINYTQDFEMLQHERALYYRVKAGGGS
jgi:chemotaxis protein methyltransferase CheR